MVTSAATVAIAHAFEVPSNTHGFVVNFTDWDGRQFVVSYFIANGAA